MKKIFTLLAALLMVVGLGLVAPGPAAADGAYCGQVWGSTEKRNTAMGPGPVTNVRTGQHSCFDRLVVDLNGAKGGYYVRYVPVVIEDGSGFSVPLRGGAFLQITVNAPAYDDSGNATYNPGNKRELQNVSGYQTFRQVAYAGSYEGHTNIGLGVRGLLPFRVFTLDGPGSGSRLIVDVGHFW